MLGTSPNASATQSDANTTSVSERTSSSAAGTLRAPMVSMKMPAPMTSTPYIVARPTSTSGGARPVPLAAAMTPLKTTVMAAAIRMDGLMSVCRPRRMATEKPAKPTAEASAARSPRISASARPSPIMIRDAGYHAGHGEPHRPCHALAQHHPAEEGRKQR